MLWAGAMNFSNNHFIGNLIVGVVHIQSTVLHAGIAKQYNKLHCRRLVDFLFAKQQMHVLCGRWPCNTMRLVNMAQCLVCWWTAVHIHAIFCLIGLPFWKQVSITELLEIIRQVFYSLDAFPVSQPTMSKHEVNSKHWLQSGKIGLILSKCTNWLLREHPLWC